MKTKIGLIGLYNSSNFREDISSVYMISDEDTASLFIFVLFPGSYYDVYEIASLTTYQNIFIIPISIYPEYISDIYRLVMNLTPIKTRVKVMSPDALIPPIMNSMASMFLNSFIKGSTKSSFVYSTNGFIAFDWNESNEAPCTSIWPSNYHDIYCTFGEKRILLTVNKVDIGRIKALLEKDLVDYVYIPWQNNAYSYDGYATFADIYEEFKGTDHEKKLVPYGFPNIAAIDICKEKYPDNFPVIARALFIDEEPIGEDWLDCVTYGEAVLTCDEQSHLDNDDKKDKCDCKYCKSMKSLWHYHPFGSHGPISMPPPPPGPLFWRPEPDVFCPICNPPKCTCDKCNKDDSGDTDKTEDIDILATAFALVEEACPQFGDWVISDAHTCDDTCGLRKYIIKDTNPTDPTEPTDPSTGDNTGTTTDPDTGDTSGDQGTTGEDTGNSEGDSSSETENPTEDKTTTDSNTETTSDDITKQFGT